MATGTVKRCCFECGKSGHIAKYCPSKPRSSSYHYSRSCYNCGQVGHLMKDCTKRKHYTELSPRQQYNKETVSSVQRTRSKDTQLPNAHSKDTQLPEAHSKDTQLPDAHSKDTQLPNARSKDTQLSNTHSKDTQLSNTHSKDTQLPNAHSKDTQLPNTRSKDTQLPNDHSKDTQLPNAHSKDTELPNTHLKDTQLPNAHSKDTQLPYAHSKDTQLPNAHSKDTQLPNTHSKDTQLPNAHSKDTQLPYPHSKDTQLPNAHSKDTQLPNAHSLEDLPSFDDELFEYSKDSSVHYNSSNVKRKKRRKDVSLYERVINYPNYLDTHCHLEYLMERHKLSSYSCLASTFNYPSNFDGCITSFCDPVAYSSFSCANELLEEEKVWATFGIHPHHSYTYNGTLHDKLVQCLTHSKCVALGEIGLDYSSHSLKYSTMSRQKQVLYEMLSLAQSYNKPVVIHCREAEDDMYDILSTGLPSDWFIHLHCYTGTVDMALRFITSFPNLYIGLTGHLTHYKFNNSREMIPNIPLERVLIETDSPYMLPYSMRGGPRWTHPPMSVCVAEEITKLRNDCTVEQVLATTRDNARIIYGI